jgi:pyrroline-5-carboxylate reductase
LAEALRKHAVQYGITPDVAQRAVSALLIGTGKLLDAHPQPTSDIVQEFEDYKGVIAASLEAMKKSGFESAIGTGLEAGLIKLKAMSVNRQN